MVHTNKSPKERMTYFKSKGQVEREENVLEAMLGGVTLALLIAFIFVVLSII